MLLQISIVSTGEMKPRGVSARERARDTEREVELKMRSSQTVHTQGHCLTIEGQIKRGMEPGMGAAGRAAEKRPAED
ncbi:hypothetical protein F7725_027666 [Dissostichus mawsoni]|uniref:Uncharacterized protein n=1 Tax=Dissostichus mawsoni TaxID=36200 RepID=A0A7J5XFW4_DISMA|nr:hypothetical protein F7725_027666 [Dissostichus mawsoni]